MLVKVRLRTSIVSGISSGGRLVALLVRRNRTATRRWIHRALILHEPLSGWIARGLSVERSIPIRVHVVEVWDRCHTGVLPLRLIGLSKRSLTILRLICICLTLLQRTTRLLGLRQTLGIVVSQCISAGKARLFPFQTCLACQCIRYALQHPTLTLLNAAQGSVLQL